MGTFIQTSEDTLIGNVATSIEVEVNDETQIEEVIGPEDRIALLILEIIFKYFYNLEQGPNHLVCQG